MSFEHIMLDLETLSSRSDAAIVSIGAVRFDLKELRISEEEFYAVIDPQSSIAAGLKVDGSTIKWWIHQDWQAKEVFSEDGQSLYPVLQNFSGWVAKVPDSFIWGNGSTFDNVILANAYQACGLTIPWSHKRSLCFRTIRWILNTQKIEQGTKHNALTDAKNQAISFIKAMELRRVL